MERRLQEASADIGKLSPACPAPYSGCRVLPDVPLFVSSDPPRSPVFHDFPGSCLFDPENSPPLSTGPIPPGTPQGITRVAPGQATLATARTRRNWQQRAGSGSSEGEDSPRPFRPARKRQRLKACLPGHTDPQPVGGAVGRRQDRVAPSALVPEEEWLSGDWLEVDTPCSLGPRDNGFSEDSSDHSPVRPRSRGRKTHPQLESQSTLDTPDRDSSSASGPSMGPAVQPGVGTGVGACVVGRDRAQCPSGWSS